MDTCEILKSILALEMQVHESLLKIHKCAVGETFPEDPHVNNKR